MPIKSKRYRSGALFTQCEGINHDHLRYISCSLAVSLPTPVPFWAPIWLHPGNNNRNCIFGRTILSWVGMIVDHIYDYRNPSFMISPDHRLSSFMVVWDWMDRWKTGFWCRMILNVVTGVGCDLLHRTVYSDRISAVIARWPLTDGYNQAIHPPWLLTRGSFLASPRMGPTQGLVHTWCRWLGQIPGASHNHCPAKVIQAPGSHIGAF